MSAAMILKKMVTIFFFKWKKLWNKELLDKCERGNKIAPLWHKCQAKRGTRAKGCHFIAPLALIQQLYYQYFILLLNHIAILGTIAEKSEAYMLKGCIKNYSIAKLYNKVLVILLQQYMKGKKNNKHLAIDSIFAAFMNTRFSTRAHTFFLLAAQFQRSMSTV